MPSSLCSIWAGGGGSLAQNLLTGSSFSWASWKSDAALWVLRWRRQVSLQSRVCRGPAKGRGQPCPRPLHTPPFASPRENEGVFVRHRRSICSPSSCQFNFPHENILDVWVTRGLSLLDCPVVRTKRRRHLSKYRGYRWPCLRVREFCTENGNGWGVVECKDYVSQAAVG